MISVLIPTKNGASYIHECLQRVFEQEVKDEFEVVLVDSGSTDTTLEQAQQFPVRILTIPSEEFHHARTRNLLAEISKGDRLVFLSQDAYPASPDWLSSLVRNFDDPSVGAVYGRQIPKHGAGAERHQVFGTIYGEEKIVKEPTTRSNLGYRYYLFSTVNCGIRRDVWQQTRFPEELKVFEDVGIAKRILDAGWKIVYEPEAAVYHSDNLPATALFRRYFDIGVVFQRLGVWDEVSRKSLRRDGWRGLVRNLTLLREKDGFGNFVVTTFYSAMKYSGIVLGRNEQLLPVCLKRRFSYFGLFRD